MLGKWAFLGGKQATLSGKFLGNDFGKQVTFECETGDPLVAEQSLDQLLVELVCDDTNNIQLEDKSIKYERRIWLE